MQFLVFAVVFIGVAYGAQPSCPNGEVFTQCGKACESTCDRPNMPCVMMICMSGCVCPEGHHRHLETGECVKLEDCPATPPTKATPVFPVGCANANEVYKTCGPMIQPTCANRNPIMISLRCNPGCFCAEGYVRDARGECIKEEDCSKPMIPLACAHENEVYKTCGPMVEASCARPNPIFVSLRCRRGCFCVEGYTRGSDGRCVKKEECAKSACPSGETFSQCVPVSEPSCAVPVPRFISLRCFPGCKCTDRAQYRNADGRCVSSAECGSEKKCLRDRAESTGLIGSFTPMCDEVGNYAAKQCHSSTGFCWCVDHFGQELDGTRRGPTEMPVSC